MSSRTLGCLLLAAVLAGSAGAVVPGQVDFQGLLLDDDGNPVNGSVVLGFTLFDAPTAGTAQWTETLTGVQIVDGVYSVTLGAQTPITPALLSSGSLHLEVSVDGETLSPRQPLLAVPYAIQAESTNAVGGLSSVFFTEIIEHVSFDGGDPPNDDPREGVADIDADGLANFIDPDNDGDGISDVDEESQGTDLNLPTPILNEVLPGFVRPGSSTLFLSGTSFEAGMTVVVDGTPALVQNVTPTSAEALVTLGTVGTQALVLTLPNGQSTGGDVEVLDARRVFSALTPDAGNLGGVAGADAICNAEASVLGITGTTFLAWVADAVSGPVDRFAQSAIPYARLDGVQIAADWSDLVDGQIDASISNAINFTNVAADGTTKGPNWNCSDWTESSSTVFGRKGQGMVLGNWTDFQTAVCNWAEARIYCFEQ